ncbi:MAG TPA: hypothetical protein VK171_06440 [Fimbriimonas sp.]|nr:hypothetical protein [Fimbriimonas sp.]
MTLRVPFAGFAEAVRRNLSTHDVYVHADRARTIVTAGQSDRTAVVIATVRQPKDEVVSTLHAEGFHVFDGFWSIDDDQELLELPYISAVAYRANAKATGVWVDASTTEPTPVQVLQAMYSELSEANEIDGVSFDEFTELAQATVTIISPVQLERFLEAKH